MMINQRSTSAGVYTAISELTYAFCIRLNAAVKKKTIKMDQRQKDL